MKNGRGRGFPLGRAGGIAHPSGMKFTGLVFGLVGTFGLTVAAEEIRLWPGTAPGDSEAEARLEQSDKPSKPGEPVLRRVQDVAVPTIEHYAPKPEIDTGSCVLIAPGGGYNILAFQHEGTSLCEKFTEIGVHAVLLKYRVPRRAGRLAHEAPLQDAQRALGLVRSKAEEWGIDPRRIGMLGFSAGGNLTAFAGTEFAKRTYTEVDAADKLSARPDFLMLIYAAYIAETKPANSPSPIDSITAETPPTFLLVAGDDRFAPGSTAFYSALRKVKVPAELHIYEKGGHGFGIDRAKGPIAGWFEVLGSWMETRGLLKK